MSPHLRSSSFIHPVLLISTILVGISLLFQSTPSEAGEIGDSLSDSCRTYVERTLIEERDAYRRVQYSDAYVSVLDAEGVKTTALVPYLVVNYHALSCRLRSLCVAVGKSVNHASGSGMVAPTRPLGCSRVFAARGRWWSDSRREVGYNDAPIPECSFFAYTGPSSPATATGAIQGELADLAITDECDASVKQILQEERAMLRVFVAQDATSRGARLVSGVFQSALSDIRDGFLHPLRGVVDLFGSVLHPISCLLTQCN